MFSEEQILSLAKTSYDAGDFERAHELVYLLPGEVHHHELGCAAAYESAKADLTAGDIVSARGKFKQASKGMSTPAGAALARERVRLLSGRQASKLKAGPTLGIAARVKPVLELSHTQFAPLVDHVIAMAAYRSGYDLEKGDLLSRAIRKMKRGSGLELAPAFGDALANLLLGVGKLPVAADMIVPVPSDLSRLARRGYSITAIMSEVISGRMAIPLCPKVVETVGEVPELRTIARGQRMNSIEGKYRVGQPDYVRGRSILIVDDVITSGATIKTVAAELKRHGATNVSAIAIAHSESSQ